MSRPAPAEWEWASPPQALLKWPGSKAHFAHEIVPLLMEVEPHVVDVDLVDGEVMWGPAGGRVVNLVTRMCYRPTGEPTTTVSCLLGVAQALGLVTQRDNLGSAPLDPPP